MQKYGGRYKVRIQELNMVCDRLYIAYNWVKKNEFMEINIISKKGRIRMER